MQQIFYSKTPVQVFKNNYVLYFLAVSAQGTEISYNTDENNMRMNDLCKIHNL